MDKELEAALEEIRQEDVIPEKHSKLFGDEGVEVEEDEGWLDVEEDIEPISVQSLFDQETFADVQSMLQYCLQTYSFDFLKVKKDFDLNFLGTVRLVNYIRSEVKRGRTNFDLSSKNVFSEDQYLLPVLEDDAFLFSLGDLEEESASFLDIEESAEQQDRTAPVRPVASIQESVNQQHSTASIRTVDTVEMVRIIENLKVNIERVNRKLQAYKGHVVDFKDSMRRQLKRNINVNDILRGRRWSGSDISMLRAAADYGVGNYHDLRTFDPAELVSNGSGPAAGTPVPDDAHYYQSYAQIDIHETMLKDEVRTKAYRDFIYSNKHLFEGKTVLDVGCGSGILSLFCAAAGAKRVYAVDKSDIINRARAVVYDNKLDHIIKCLHGRIEDMDRTDIPEVDIIISEWMGYSLLYEAMLDSVLYARDHFLSPTGLIIPSDASLYIAPIYDPAYTREKITFWDNVYGFNMTALTSQIYQDVRVRTLSPDSLAGTVDNFRHLNLYACERKDLTFRAPFGVTLQKPIHEVDGWAIWFDVLFAAKPGKALVSLHLPTGPDRPETHWQQSYLLMDPALRRHPEEGAERCDVVGGEVTFAKRPDNDRELDIGVRWTAARQGEAVVEERDAAGEQTWAMR